ncbi:MAG: dihydroneopterin aldolase [Bacteroidota bacterium]|nr:dihydroneopterin aldolase [Bacteroidota bacterium]
MLSIHLHNVIFFAYHGLYEHEKINGNEFEVNVSVDYQPSDGVISNIENTINYVDVFQLVQQRMSMATPLLETVVMDIAGQIIARFSLAEKVSVSIKKLNPPIKDFRGTVGVSFTVSR